MPFDSTAQRAVAAASTSFPTLIPMKSTSLLLVALAGFASVSPALAADTETKPVKVEKKSVRVVSGSDERGVKEPVTFLGVETAPVSETLSAQLGLAEGTGLVVRTVVPDSPAVGTLRPHDILVKLDDQILVEVRQLAVLIGQKKAGDEVSLTLMRKGKEEPVRVTLAQRDHPKRVMQMRLPGVEGRLGEWGPAPAPFLRQGGGPRASRSDGLRELGDGQDVDDVLRAIDDTRARGPRVHVFNRSGSGDGETRDVTIVNATQSKLLFTDDEWHAGAFPRRRQKEPGRESQGRHRGLRRPGQQPRRTGETPGSGSLPFRESGENGRL